MNIRLFFALTRYTLLGLLLVAGIFAGLHVLLAHLETTSYRLIAVLLSFIFVSNVAARAVARSIHALTRQ